MAFTERLHQEGYLFKAIQVYKRVVISLVEVYEKGGEICHFRV